MNLDLYKTTVDIKFRCLYVFTQVSKSWTSISKYARKKWRKLYKDDKLCNANCNELSNLAGAAIKEPLHPSEQYNWRNGNKSNIA